MPRIKAAKGRSRTDSALGETFSRERSKTNPARTMTMGMSQDAAATTKSDGTKILIVDDADAVLAHLSKALADAGFEPVVASDGVEAQAQLARHPDIRLAVVDIHMPRMNGQQLLEHVRSLEGFQDLPVVMLTTDRKPANLNRAMSTGATGWVLKPYDPERLIESFHRIIAA